MFPSSAALPQPVRMLLPFPRNIGRQIRSARSKIASRQTPTGAVVSNLETSLNPADTLRSLRRHRWSYTDAQYLLLAFVAIFTLSVIQSPGPIVKTFVATLILGGLVVPMTRQFLLPLLAIIAWLVFFYSAQFIPSEYRPPIWVRVLPALENIFYGANISNLLSAHRHTALDILAWIPYGLTHFGGPVVASIIFFIWGPPGYLPNFARTFGYMNVLGVTIQILFPCSPPWYETMHGLAAANYSMKGSPAGLAAIDKLLGIDLYTSGFTASPVVFGAFPSLHAANATSKALFMSQLFPRLRPLFALYTLWMCWATMYLQHHYAVDLVAGALLAGGCFYVSYRKFLPRVQLDKATRWDYDYVEYGQPKYSAVSSSNYIALLTKGDELPVGSDSDEWTIGSSSSVASSTHSRSPSSTTTLGGRSLSGGRKSSEFTWPESDTTIATPSDTELATFARQKEREL